VNKVEKEQYLREYALLKAQGKPFFPYAVAKDSVMFVVVMAAIITMSIVLGAELGPKADPTTTTYTPRPEWYFFFLFELLRVIKPPELVPLATIGIPTICMILLFLLPFYDRGPERRPERRPIATAAGLFTIAAWATSRTSAPRPARRRRSTCPRRSGSRRRARGWSRSTRRASSSSASPAASHATRSVRTATAGPGRR
jgi:quinol-cytochrome oxidoreductase complex cytochrome b subunit